MALDQQYLRRRLFFVGEYRRRRLLRLMQRRREAHPAAMQLFNPEDVTAGGLVLINRMDEVSRGELNQWLDRMDLTNESPSLIFRVNILDMSFSNLLIGYCFTVFIYYS